MSKPGEIKGPDGCAKPLLPERLSYLLDDKPLLWSESEAEYDALLGEIFVELDPQGVIETILAKDVADYVWEVRRMRSLRVASIHAEMPAAAGVFFESHPHKGVQNIMALQMRPLVLGAMAGLPVQTQSLMKQLNDLHVTPEMMHYEAMKSGMAVMSAIEVSILRLERRRDQLLKQLSERRQAFKAMANGLLERDGIQTVDIAEQPH